MRRVLHFNEFMAFDQLRAEIDRSERMVNESYVDELIEQDLLNEALSSGFLRSIFDGMPTDSNGKSLGVPFGQIFYNSFKVSLNDITDSDFVQRSDVGVAFSEGKKRPNTFYFMMCDNQATIDEMRKLGATQLPNPFLVAVIRGGKGVMASDSATDSVSTTPKGSKYSSRWQRQSENDRVGWLSNKGNVMGRVISKMHISVNQTRIKEMSTFCFELDVDALIARLGTTADIRKQRYEQKQGNLVWKPGDEAELKRIRQRNADNYKLILSQKVSMRDLVDIYGEIEKTGNGAIEDFLMKADFTSPESVAQTLGFGDGWANKPRFLDRSFREIRNVMNNSLDVLGRALDFCYEYYRSWDRVQGLIRSLETEQDPEKAVKIKSEVDWYQNSNQKELKSLVEFKTQLLRYQNDMNKAIA